MDTLLGFKVASLGKLTVCVCEKWGGKGTCMMRVMMIKPNGSVPWLLPLVWLFTSLLLQLLLES